MAGGFHSHLPIIEPDRRISRIRLSDTENCIVTVHLAYAAGDFHCLLDGDLFLPGDWSNDRARCREAGIPDDVVYRPKWKIALELFDRARNNGATFDWLTFDEGYGGKPAYLRELHSRKQRYVGEVPTTSSAVIGQPLLFRALTPRLTCWGFRIFSRLGIMPWSIAQTSADRRWAK